MGRFEPSNGVRPDYRFRPSGQRDDKSGAAFPMKWTLVLHRDLRPNRIVTVTGTTRSPILQDVLLASVCPADDVDDDLLVLGLVLLRDQGLQLDDVADRTGIAGRGLVDQLLQHRFRLADHAVRRRREFDLPRAPMQ